MANAIQIQSGGTAYKIKDSLARSATIANIFNVQDWENGAINETNGTNASSSERIRLTGYLPATAKDLSSANSNIRFMLYGYTATTGVYVGALQSDGTFGTNAGSFATIDMTKIYTAHPVWKFRLVIRLAGGSVQVDNVPEITISTLLYDIPKNTAKADSAININTFNASNFVNGAIAYADGTNVSSSSRIRSAFIPDCANYFYSTDANIRFQLFAWDASGEYVGALYNGEFSPEDVTVYSFLDLTLYRSNGNYKGYKYKVVILSVSGDVRVESVSGVYIENISQRATETDIALRDTNLSTSYNINTALLWENGGINLATGRNAVSPTRARTRMVLPTNAGVVSFGTHTQYRGMFICAYDLNGIYRGAYKSDGTFVKDGTETGWSTFDLQTLYKNFPNYRYRITVYVRNGGTSVLPSEYEDWSITNALYTKPFSVKVIQYNAGKFNMGFAHTDPHVTDTATKIANMKEFFANENPDILCMQEMTEYIDTSDTIATDATLFDPLFFNKSWYERETSIKCQYPLTNTRFSYIHTSGDNSAWVIYGEMEICGRKVAVASGVLNSSAPAGIDHQEQGIRALTKLTEQLLVGYDYAIVGMDCNCLSQTESDAFRDFMADKGYKSGNWGYLGNKDTYNLSSQYYRAIDNVFVKGNAKIVNFAVPSVYDSLASDHFPVIAEIRFM